MSAITTAAALATSAAAALALYARSRHCRWRVPGRLRRAGLPLGATLAGAALAQWIAAYGAGAGLCAALASTMLAAIALPYLAWLGARPHEKP